MLRSFYIIFLLLALTVVACAGDESALTRQQRPRGSDIFLVPDTATVKDRVPPRATLASLLHGLNLRTDVVTSILERTRDVFDARRLHAGNAFELVRTTDGLLRYFEYEIDIERYLRVAARAGDEATTVTAEVRPYNTTRVVESVSGEISSDAPSLFAAMDDAGQGPDLTLALADVFSGEIDFNTDLQRGDSFRVAVERVMRDGEPVGYGPISAAQFTNGGKTLCAVRFTPPGGKAGYYDEHGRSLVRFFLASPLKLTLHITSKFSKARFHPILKIFRPHLGVDYAAPQGAPVVAVANGTVVSAGMGGQGGKTVRLRHASGYDTYYMHLSSIAVRTGQRISQGQLIGRVGMTGLATGPHLDYRISKNGGFINPATIQKSLPPGEPIPPGAMAQFNAERDAAFAKLEGRAAAAAVPPSAVASRPQDVR